MKSFQLSDDRVVVVKKTAGKLMVTIKHKEDNNKYIWTNIEQVSPVAILEFLSSNLAF